MTSTKSFSWLTRSTPIFIAGECSNIYKLCMNITVYKKHFLIHIPHQFHSAICLDNIAEPFAVQDVIFFIGILLASK